MAYIRHDIDNNVVSPQPSSVTVDQFSGTEGWTTVSYSDWNGDYVPRDVSNTVRIPGTYQARTADNTPRTPAAYQRHDVNNDPVEI